MVYIIGVTGGSGSGKTSTCRVIIKQLQLQGIIKEDISVISMDSFYIGISNESYDGKINFDHPAMFDWSLIFSTFHKLKNGKSVEIPIYNFVNHKRDGWVTVEPGKCIIFEGILALYDERVRGLMDIKIFVDTPPDICLIRRIRRDIEERGRTVSSVLDQCELTVIPSREQFIDPTKKYADLIIPRGKSNSIAINVMVNMIHRQMVK